MATATSDSDLRYGFGPLPNFTEFAAVGDAAPTNGTAPAGPLQVYDLVSEAPLPAFPDELPNPPLATFPSQQSATPRREYAPGTIWLDGAVILCACPECRAPMCVRLWLMIADCWNCGTSIELSEEQEREVQRL